EQRDTLRQKGYQPHMLVMTATPIPRTLALTLYGDLDVSVIDQLPPGRQKVITRWRTGARRTEANTLIAHQVAEGHQAFIICPLIEESDRFGLSQLHQFRGRVGRGIHQSYCYVLSADASIKAQERLEIFQSTDDGFRLAEEDLRLRGPGDFIGVRQSGMPELRMADLSDTRLIELTR